MRLAAGWAATVGRSGPIRLVAVPLLVALGALIWIDPPWVQRLQSAWFDAYQVVSPRDVASMPATIVEIDQKSLAAIGQWPWPRPVLAELIRDINRHRPVAIGIDIFMPEADGQSLARLVARTGNSEPTVTSQLAALSASDAELAKTLAAAPTVLAIVGSDSATGMLLRAAPFVVSSVSAGAAPAEDAARWVPRFRGALTSLDQLDRAAAGHGLISIDATGGVLRRIPLAANIN